MRIHAGHRDRGDVVLGWLTKVVASMALVGLVGFDAVSIGATQFQAEDHAQAAVRAAVESYRADKNVQTSYDAALGAVIADGDSIDVEGYAVGADGSVTLRLRRVAPTLLVEKVRQLRSWTDITSTVTGRPAD